MVSKDYVVALAVVALVVVTRLLLVVVVVHLLLGLGVVVSEVGIRSTGSWLSWVLVVVSPVGSEEYSWLSDNSVSELY